MEIGFASVWKFGVCGDIEHFLNDVFGVANWENDGPFFSIIAYVSTFALVTCAKRLPTLIPKNFVFGKPLPNLGKSLRLSLGLSLWQDASPCGEDALPPIRALDNLGAEERKVAQERYTLIAGILPNLGNNKARAEAIKQTAEVNNLSRKTITNYLCVIVLYPSFPWDDTDVQPKRVMPLLLEHGFCVAPKIESLPLVRQALCDLIESSDLFSQRPDHSLTNGKNSRGKTELLFTISQNFFERGD